LGVCGVAALALTAFGGGVFMYLILGFLAYQNVQAMRGATLSGAVRSRDRGIEELLKSAKAAADAERWDEAARTCHQIRAATNPGPKVLGEVWTLLGLCSVRMGKHSDALGFLKRAPSSRQVAALNRECLQALGMESELAELEKRQQDRARGSKLRYVFAAALLLFVAGGFAGQYVWFRGAPSRPAHLQTGSLTLSDRPTLTVFMALSATTGVDGVSRFIASGFRQDDDLGPELMIDARLERPFSAPDFLAQVGKPMTLVFSPAKPGRLSSPNGEDPLVLTGGELTILSARAGGIDLEAEAGTFSTWRVTGTLTLNACTEHQTPCDNVIKAVVEAPLTVVTPPS
jgi:hypothetical protein